MYAHMLRPSNHLWLDSCLRYHSAEAPRMEERNLNTWEEFEETLRDLRKEHDQSDVQLKSSSLLFRGQEDSCWLLKTTLERRRERMLFNDYYLTISRIRPE